MIRDIEKSFIKLTIVFLLLVSILLSGCSSTVPVVPGNSETNESIIQVSIIEEPFDERVTLNSAIATLNDDDIGLGMGRHTGYTIHNIIGRDLDHDGRAHMWIMSVNSTDPFYFIYAPERFYTMEWVESTKDTAINLTLVLHPEDLFFKQDLLIQDLTNNRTSTLDELELRNGVYYLRGNHPGDIWERTFDAVTGEQLS